MPLLHGATRFQRTRHDGSSATRKYPCVSRVRGTLLPAAAPSRTASKSTICDRRRRRGTASARSSSLPRRGQEQYEGEDVVTLRCCGLDPCDRKWDVEGKSWYI